MDYAHFWVSIFNLVSLTSHESEKFKIGRIYVVLSVIDKVDKGILMMMMTMITMMMTITLMTNNHDILCCLTTWN